MCKENLSIHIQIISYIRIVCGGFRSDLVVLKEIRSSEVSVGEVVSVGVGMHRVRGHRTHGCCASTTINFT